MDVWEKHYLCRLIANRYINDTEGRDRGNEAGEGLRTLHSQRGGTERAPGIPFDPTQYPSPDLTVPGEQRQIGGLGIHYIRKMSDGMTYRREDGRNILIVETKVEGDRMHLDPDFDAEALAKLIGVSKERLDRLFRNKSMYRTPEAYIDNLRLLAAMRLLREKPNYNIASIAEDAGFKHVRTMQRKLTDALGLTPAEYRALYTRDL